MVIKEITKCNKIKTYRTYNISLMPKRLKNANSIIVDMDLSPQPDNFVIVVSKSNEIMIKRHEDVLIDDFTLKGVVVN